MRVQAGREDRLGAPGDAPGHDDRLPAGGRAVIHGGIGDIAAEEPRHLGLELEQHLQRALRDLRLIGRVAGQELAALDQMIDARRHMMPIGAAAEEEGRVARRQVCAGPARTIGAPPPVSDACIGQPLDRAGEARRLGHVDEQVVDRGARRSCAASARRSASDSGR